MNKALSTALALLVGLIVLAGPVFIAMSIAERQSVRIESKKALSLADEVMHRTDETGRQAVAVSKTLSANRSAKACSPDEIGLMRKLAISSSYLQSVGRVQANRLVCSSMGDHGAGFDLGPPDYVSNLGATIRVFVTLPVAPQARFVVAERDGYAAIMDRQLIFDVHDYVAGTSLAIIGASTGRPISARGYYDPAWRRPLAQGGAQTYTHSNFIVALRRSNSLDLITVAAIPIKTVQQLSHALMVFLLPLGLLVGAALAACFFIFVRQQRSVPALLRAALRRDEFFLVYQPILSLATRQCIGAEALLRWRQRDGALMLPDLFIPIAEVTGIIRPITRRILSLVEREVPALVSAFPQLHVSVNLSSRDLQCDDIVKQLGELMRRSGMLPGTLIVEATERGLIDVDLARAVVREIRANGIGVAIDDFGTGYSCLAYLATLNVDFLKIDKSFVETIGGAAPSNTVVQHIIEMAKSLNLGMIAEGVETEAQAAFLRERGVQFAQGYLYARPMSSEDFMLYMKSGAAEWQSSIASCGAANEQCARLNG